MRSLPDRLNDQLEDFMALRSGKKQSGQLHTPAPGASDERDSLVAIAQRFQEAPLLQVDPLFARRLEQRILIRNVALQRGRSTKNTGFWLFQSSVLATKFVVRIA